MKINGHPVTHYMIIVKVNFIYRKVNLNIHSVRLLKRGWVDQFVQRGPNLTLGSLQVVKWVHPET